MYMCILVLLILSLGSVVQSTDQCYSGTTLHLMDIVLGRCWSYQHTKNRTDVNCTTLWKVFYDGFAFKNPCTVNDADYEPLFNAVKGQDIVNKTLFWSGTRKAVHDYSDFDLRFTTLEDTLEGLMMNDLCWCGNPSDGIDYKSCPRCTRSLMSITAFWALASKKFAERARGIVRVMVNGTRVNDSGAPIPSYSRSSFFGKIELPSFNVSTITKLQVLVVHTIGVEPIEKCNTKSIKLLKEDAKARGIKVVDCTDDQDDVKHILCADSPQARECLFLANHQKDCRLWKSAVVVLGVLLFVATIALLVFVSILCRKLRKNSSAL